MNQYLGEKSVAWFKLAECIGRGEKERAIGLYRLLTYSFEDQAFVKKLEAEIVATFDKELAAKEFVSAAHLYFIRGDTQETFFIYQTLHSLFPEKPEYLERLIDMTQHADEIVMYQRALCSALLQEGSCFKAAELLPSLKKSLGCHEYVDLTQHFVVTALTGKNVNQELITRMMHETLDTCLRFNLDQKLQHFMSSLQGINILWYQDALTYLSSKK